MIDRLNAALADRYRVDRKLGEGGMATVFLATDLRHDRQVALKVLKPELGAVVGGERFLAEIRTTANLQHPHILPLFDSGEADGLIFYVMPYVEGESLQDRLKREGQLPVEDAVRITTKVLAALEQAHGAGVVHRDVKPANILLAGGEPLVADFGIALAVSQAGDGRITETGLTLGTPHYMSPEQATGDRAVDPRSDLYSVACVLYEMLAGQPPFVAATAQAVLAKLLTEEAPDVRTQRRSVPEHVAAAVETGLERLPADRFQTAGALAEALGNPGYRGRRAGRTRGAAGIPAGVGAGRRWVSLLGWGVAAVLVLAWTLRPEPGPATAPSPILFTLPSAEGDGVDFNTLPTLSPDQRSVVFDVRGEAGSGLRLHRLETGTTEPLEGTRGARWPFFSADGRRVGFFVDDALHAIDLDTRQVEVLARDPAVGLFEQRGLWLDDGWILLDHNETDDLWALPPGRSAPVRLAAIGAIDGISGFGVTSTSARLPGGHGVVTGFDDRDGPVPILVTPSSGSVRPLRGDVEEGWVLTAWADTLVVGDGSLALELIQVDPDAGEARRVETRSMATARWRPGSGTQGSRVLTSLMADTEGTQRLVRVARDGAMAPLALDASNWEYPRISPSGDRLLATQYAIDFADLRQLVVDLRTGAATPLPPGGEHAWGPEGVYVYWNEFRDAEDGEPEAGYAVVRHRADGTGSKEVVVSGLDQPAWVTSVSPDGRGLLFYSQSISEVELGTGTVRTLIDDDGIERNGMFSPDGRFIAYSATLSGREAVYVKPYPALDRRWTISPGAGQLPMWSPDGDELFYVDGTRVYAVPMEVSPEGVLQPGPPELLFDQPFHRNSVGDQSYDVAPDGSLIMIEGVRAAKVAVLVNWLSELPRTNP